MLTKELGGAETRQPESLTNWPADPKASLRAHRTIPLCQLPSGCVSHAPLTSPSYIRTTILLVAAGFQAFPGVFSAILFVTTPADIMSRVSLSVRVEVDQLVATLAKANAINA